ncbi:MAG: two component transcriptional regulator, winged helix family [Acidimicrobiaceae bacterium]|nr:two component transcriptional regulator, winged helix family [Acidimicrobiaceae bacterium]
MLTAADASSDRVHGLRLEADDYLVKRFDFDELVLRIRGLARRKPPPTHASFTRRMSLSNRYIVSGVRTFRSVSR